MDCRPGRWHWTCITHARGIERERAMGWRQHVYQALILGVFVAFLFTIR